MKFVKLSRARELALSNLLNDCGIVPTPDDVHNARVKLASLSCRQFQERRKLRTLDRTTGLWSSSLSRWAKEQAEVSLSGPPI